MKMRKHDAKMKLFLPEQHEVSIKLDSDQGNTHYQALFPILCKYFR